MIKTNIKILYVQEGYLPNYPYHLISDIEMCDAFLNDTNTGFFYDKYPNNFEGLQEQYEQLVSDIQYHLTKFKTDALGEYKLPNWVLSYMSGNVISSESSLYDIHDLLSLLNIQNIDDIFTEEAALKCYDISKKWIKRLSISDSEHRPATIFGEPHVIKALRLLQVSK